MDVLNIDFTEQEEIFMGYQAQTLMAFIIFNGLSFDNEYTSENYRFDFSYN